MRTRKYDLGTAAPDSPRRACGADADVDAAFYSWDYVCFAATPGGSTCGSTYERECIKHSYRCGLSSYGDILCGPVPPIAGIGLEANACCYVLTGDCALGRPFIVDGEIRVARAAHGEGWRTKLTPDTAGLDQETRRALADFYRQEGLTEHASVASFARFVLQCLALGAPAELVALAQRAGLEEIEHARLSFGLASAYSGNPERPLGIDVGGALESAVDPDAVALSVAREGCIAETVSVLLIAAARDSAEDPVVRRALSTVADQELEHSLLAWRYLRWALERGDRELRRKVADVFARPELAVGLGPTTSVPGCSRALRAHGYLSVTERRSIAYQALREVVAPAARALLESVETPETLPTTVDAESPS